MKRPGRSAATCGAPPQTYWQPATHHGRGIALATLRQAAADGLGFEVNASVITAMASHGVRKWCMAHTATANGKGVAPERVVSSTGSSLVAPKQRTAEGVGEGRPRLSVTLTRLSAL